MRKMTLAAATIALVLIGGPAFADDSSMSQWTGESYKAFEAARIANAGTPKVARTALNAIPDNSLSQFGGDSYVAFKASRVSPEISTTTVAEVREGVRPSHERPLLTAIRGKTLLSPFRDDTAA
jgi:hypothetical protein